MINSAMEIKGSKLFLCTLDGNVVDTSVSNFKVTIRTKGEH